MEREILYGRIEAYLAGSMNSEEREQFEREIAADPGLAGEVALHRRLGAFISDQEKLAFRQKVAEAEEAFTVQSMVNRTWLRGLGFLLALLAFLGAWWYLSREKQQVAPSQSAPSIPTETIQTDTTQAAPATPDTSAAPLPAPRSTVPARNPFAPLRALEKELNQERDVYLSIEVALLEIFPGTAAGSQDVRFNGRLLTALEPPALELQLLDNSAPEGRLLLRIPVAVSLIDEGQNYRAFAAKKAYNLEAVQTAALPKGLYYGRLAVASEDRGIWMGKARAE